MRECFAQYGKNAAYLPDVRVDGNGAVLIEREERNAVGHLGSNASKPCQRATHFLERKKAKEREIYVYIYNIYMRDERESMSDVRTLTF